MLLGIYEKAINKRFSLRERLQIAKAAGFDFVEFSVDESPERLARLDWGPREIGEAVALQAELGIGFNSMAFSGLRKFPYGSKDPAVRKRALESTQKAIDLAKRLGIRNIQLAGYDEYYNPSDRETAKHFAAALPLIARMAEESCVMLSFETMDTPFMGLVSDFLERTKDVRSPWLNVYPDLGNLWQWSKGRIREQLLSGKGRIVGIHFKDTKPGVYRDVPWGEGTVDFKEALLGLKEIGYAGPVLMEMWSKNDPEETFDQNVALLKEARSFFERQKEGVF